MVRVFEYMDYHKYLHDYYSEQKRKHAYFSYQFFSQKAGFKAKDFFYRVTKGQKNLSNESMFKISTAINHNKREAEYFQNLVLFNQAKTQARRQFHFDRLTAINKEIRFFHSARQVPQNQYRIYAEWYHIVVRSIIDLYSFKADFEWLAKMVSPPITVSQARKSVALLEEFGLVVRQKDGKYTVPDKAIATGNDAKQFALHKFYSEGMKHADESMETVPRTQRSIIGTTIGISAKSYERISTRINEFRKEISFIANQDPEADRVYQMNIQLFPVSTLPEE